jgi:sugar phosphate isomerase/epimerase
MLRFGPRSGGGWHVHSQGGEIRWLVSAANIFSDPSEPQAPIQPEQTAVFWSGWFDDQAQPESGVFHHDPRTWTAKGWDTLEARLAEILPVFEAAGARLLLRPHVRHVISDAPSVRRILGKFETPALGIFLEPAAMLTAGMAGDARDHLTRILEALAHHERVAAILLTGAERPARGEADPEHDDILVPAPLTRGTLDYHDLLAVLKGHGPFERPLVLYDEDVPAQLDMLREAGVLPSQPASA